jgi:hypothetical protein
MLEFTSIPAMILAREFRYTFCMKFLETASIKPHFCAKSCDYVEGNTTIASHSCSAECEFVCSAIPLLH